MATNDLIILIAFVPIVKFLLGVSNVSVPFDTLILSVILFVVIPLAGGILTRVFVTRSKGTEYSQMCLFTNLIPLLRLVCCLRWC